MPRHRKPPKLEWRDTHFDARPPYPRKQVATLSAPNEIAVGGGPQSS
jgi:hypothetical protein